MKKTFVKIEDDCVQPFICEMDDAWEYIKSCLDGRTLNEPIKVSVIEMTQKKFDKLPEFEG